MRLYLFVIVVIILSSCRSIYIGETPVIPTMDSTKKTTATLSAGNAQLLVYNNTHWLYGGKLDYHFLNYYGGPGSEVSATSLFLEAGIFGGYNFRNSLEKNPICIFAGSSGGLSIYNEHYRLHDQINEGWLNFRGNFIQHFITLNAAINSDNPTTFVPSFSVRFFNFYDYRAVTKEFPQGWNYWSNWLPNPQKFINTYNRYYQFSITFFRRSGPNKFFVNANYNVGNSLVRPLTTRCGFLFGF